MRRLLPLALLALTAAVLPAGADPLHLPTDASGWATPNVTPTAHIATAGAGVSGAFLDSKTFLLSVADEVWNETNAPATLTGGLQIFDTTDIKHPVMKGMLPLPHFQNEDLSVSPKRQLAIISQDSFGTPGRLNVIDVSNPAQPMLVGLLNYPSGYGHTASLVGNDNYLWVSGGDDVLVIDLHDPAAPSVAGTFATLAGAKGPGGSSGVHDAEADQFGDVSVYGSGGTAVYRVSANPLKPTLVASIAPVDNTPARNGLIHHGGKRLDSETWLLTEEDYSPGCDADGSLQVWKIDRLARRLRFVSMWDAPKDADADRGALEQTSYCSSHWFSINSSKIVADGWYGAGVRFLDLSNPRKPRPVGIWAGDSTTASQAIFAPGHPDVVYVPDYVRGLDVISIKNAGKKARTVTDKDTSRVGTSTVPGLAFTVKLVPSKKWGWSCLVPELPGEAAHAH